MKQFFILPLRFVLIQFAVKLIKLGSFIVGLPSPLEGFEARRKMRGSPGSQILR